MNTHITPQSIDTPSYLQNIWNTSFTRSCLLGSIALSIASFVIFKLLYPYPDFFSDSYNYIFTAATHLDVGIWPIGYSKFLAAFHTITSSDTALVAFQYFLIQLAALHFYFTILHFFPAGLLTQKVLFFFLFVNPLSLYLSNTINSDAIFAALSLFWFTQFIWFIQRPGFIPLLMSSILLFFCFTIRNNAYYYPMVSTIAVFFTKQTLIKKMVALILPLLFLIPFIIYTTNVAKNLTGTSQFSLFTGWQLANNALYIYGQVAVDSTTLTTPESKELNRMSQKFFEHINMAKFQNYLDSYTGNFFIRQSESPLKQYWEQHFKIKDEISIITTWGKASALYKPFGQTIILHHPIAYLRYFVYPNLWRYLIPPLSHLELYNYGENYIDPIAQRWFKYSTPRIRVVSHNFQGYLLITYQAFFLLINLFYGWCLSGNFIRIWLHHSKSHLSNLQKLGLVFLVLNLGFSLVATTNILRYQFVPMIILLAFGLMSSDSREVQSKTKNKKNKSSNIAPLAFEK